MWIDHRAITQTLIRETFLRIAAFTMNAAILLSASLPPLTLGIAFASYEGSYVDATGSKCATFTIASYEADACYGRIDRLPPSNNKVHP